MGSKSLALLVAVIGVVALATAAVYLYRHHGAVPRIEDKVAKGEKPAPEQPKPVESQPAKSAPSKPTAVPSFDIVRIEPTGEGVVAGRAEPGWTVTLESSRNKIAETKADEEGAWSVVLDKPLDSGDHTLALRATSPDGTQALTAQQPVQVAVGNAEGGARSEQQSAAAEPEPEETPQAKSEAPAEAASPEARKPEQQTEAPAGVEGQPEPVVPDENAPLSERPKPPVRIGHLDYQDTGKGSGKISLSGVGNPNIRVFLFFDDQPLGQVVIGSDGTWAIDIEKNLGPGEHTVRADTYDEKTGMVAGRASVRLGREPEANKPETAKQEAATLQPQAAPAPAATPAESSATVQAEQPSGQPEPVYPEEEARLEGAAVEPSAAQPEPARPGVAKEALAAPQPEQAQPEAAPAELSAPVTAEQPGAANPPEGPKRAVVFRSVDYQDTGSESGKVSLSGTGNPGAHIFLFFDEAPLGEVIVESDGTWAFETKKKLPTGEHMFRADRMEGGVVIGRASIGIVRMAKPAELPQEEHVATQAPRPPVPATESETTSKGAEPPSQPAPQVAAAEEAKPPATGEKLSHRKRHRPRVYTVRRGDTLWEIAEAYYGRGWHYRAIARDNRRQIHNPHWIYPKQKFHISSGK